MHGTMKEALSSANPRTAVPSIIDMLCHSRQGSEEYARAAEVEAARQQMMRRLGMTEADWADAGEWAAEHQGRLMSTSVDYDRKKAWSALAPIEQFAAITKDADPTYVTDTFGHALTEVGRMGFIKDCISRDNAVAWAACQPDIEQLDRAKLRSELRTSAGSTGYERMALRIDALELEDKLKAHAAKVKALVAKDVAYGAVFSTAAAGHKRWSTTDAKLADAALAMDDARATNSRRAYEGCAERTWPALRGAIAAIPAKTYAGVDDAEALRPIERVAGIIANDPNGYLAALAYVQCKRTGSDLLTASLAGAMSRWPGYRGRRTMAITMVMNAGIQLDDQDARLEYPSTNRSWITGPQVGGASGTGTVASVKIANGQAVIGFAKNMQPGQKCTAWSTSNRVIQIRPDGTLVYDSSCTAYRSYTYDASPKPQTVDAQYVDGLKPGMFVRIEGGVVLLAWPKAKAKVPSHVAGVAVR